MPKLHVVTGLPRSGSTLLCNLLCQNPDIWASSTSPLCQIVAGVSHMASTAPEFKSDLIGNRADAEGRLDRTLRVMAAAWYPAGSRPHVFDKGRGWSLNSRLLRSIAPDSVVLAMVRDPREVIASIEKQHAANPQIDDTPTGLAKTAWARAEVFMGPEGMVGSAILGVEDLLRRQDPHVVYIDTRALCTDPAKVLGKVYDELGQVGAELEPFKHDFTQVEKTATDVDGLYLHKFPHDGDGAVRPPEGLHAWREWVSEDLGQQIVARYPYYAKTFGYGQGG